MVSKKITTVFLALSLAASICLYGCGNQDVNDDVQNVGEDIKNTAEDAGDTIKDAADNAKDSSTDLVSKIQDKSMEYNREDLKKDLADKGYKVEESKSNHSLFSVDSIQYSFNGQTISVYQYDKNASEMLENDLRTVTNHADMVNGATVNWSYNPYFFKKGRLVVIYDGNDPKTISTLQDILGTPIFA